jgi:tetratricopeptide (TPR) repeat protein
MALFDRGLAAHPDNISILYARALFAISIGRMDILEKDLGRILELDPENVDALNALGYTLADQTDRYQEAAAYINKAYALRPDEPAILDSMGWLQYRLGNYQEALGYLEQAMDRMPDSEIAAHLGEVLWVTGDRQRALKVWNDMLKKDPESRHVRETKKRLTGN